MKNNIQKIFLILILFFGFFTIAKSASAATYWISPTGAASNLAACSGSTPLSGTAACSYDKANGSGVVAGDTVYYRAGTYTISSGNAIAPYNSGAEESYITFASYSNEVAAFVGTNYNVYAVNLTGKDYIHVTGYDGATSARGITFSGFYRNIWIYNGSDYNRIDHIEVGSAFATTPSIWQASTDYSVGDYVVQTNLDLGLVMNVTTDNGSSGTTEPTWPTINNAVTDGDLVWTARAGMDYRGSTIYLNSTYNWIHHCTFHDGGYYTSTVDGGGIFELGNEASTTGTDDTNYNVVENSIFYHGGHHVFGLHNLYNVVRNNIMHNEQFFDDGSGQYYGYRIMYMSGSVDASNHGFNLIEKNVLSHGAGNKNQVNQGGAGIGMRQSNTIVRQNSFYALQNGLYINAPEAGKSNRNHVYNNTFFASGFIGNYDSNPNESITSLFRVPIAFSASNIVSNYSVATDKFVGNVFKNNIFWKNANSAGGDMIRSDVGWGACTGQGQTVCGDTVIENNLNRVEASPTDPLFTDEGTYGNPSIGDTVDWYWPSGSTPSGQDITAISTNHTLPVLSLSASSPAINAGSYLTQANGAGSSSTTLIVDDARYFRPAWGNGAGGGAVVEADWIAIGTVSNTHQISSINYATNTITLATPTTWTDDASIGLFKNSDGTQVLYGSAPDYGAYEYVLGSDTTPPQSPTGLQVQ